MVHYFFVYLTQLQTAVNKVRLRGLTQNQEFQTRAGGFCMCSRDLQSPGAIYENMIIYPDNWRCVSTRLQFPATTLNSTVL
ncbi:hypothetical protein [Mastigocladopsis repens]|uniref:hypothetical protein n=1 Tax=Mastigocladopsis repens TaxID=221287 RepID=UPI00035C3C3A|nr:hypothetical protein [Mastigocladopsis repens]